MATIEEEFMRIFNVNPEAVGDVGYRGCGKAWAAITAEGKVVALRYMGEYGVEYERFSPKTDEDFLFEWRKVHPRKDAPTNTGRRGSRWDRFCRKINEKREEEAERRSGGFGKWREEQRAALKALAGAGGCCVSGVASCYEFCVTG